MFSRKTRAVKSDKTSIIILNATRKNSNIFDVFSNNSFKRRRIINKLKNKSVFIIQSRSSSRINFNSNLFNSTKNDMNVAKATLRRKYDMRMKKFKFDDQSWASRRFKHDRKFDNKKNAILKTMISMKELMKNFKIIDHKIDVRFEAIARTINARIKEQDKKFANIYFAKITTFVKDNTSLIKQIFLLSNFVEHLHKISYKAHKIYHEVVNVQMNAQFNWNNLQITNDW